MFTNSLLLFQPWYHETAHVPISPHWCCQIDLPRLAPWVNNGQVRKENVFVAATAALFCCWCSQWSKHPQHDSFRMKKRCGTVAVAFPPRPPWRQQSPTPSFSTMATERSRCASTPLHGWRTNSRPRCCRSWHRRSSATGTSASCTNKMPLAPSTQSISIHNSPTATSPCECNEPYFLHLGRHNH